MEGPQGKTTSHSNAGKRNQNHVSMVNISISFPDQRNKDNFEKRRAAGNKKKRLPYEITIKTQFTRSMEMKAFTETEGTAGAAAKGPWL